MQAKTDYSPTNAIVRTWFTKNQFDYLNIVYVSYYEKHAEIQDINIKVCLN